MDDAIWRPRRRLRHLRSIQARNLWGDFGATDIPHLAAYVVLWSRLPHLGTLEASGDAWQPVYVSPLVRGTIAPDFGPIALPDEAPLPNPFLHDFLSGFLHVHMYIVRGATSAHVGATSDDPGRAAAACGHVGATWDDVGATSAAATSAAATSADATLCSIRDGGSEALAPNAPVHPFSGKETRAGESTEPAGMPSTPQDEGAPGLGAPGSGGGEATSALRPVSRDLTPPGTPTEREPPPLPGRAPAGLGAKADALRAHPVGVSSPSPSDDSAPARAPSDRPATMNGAGGVHPGPPTGPRGSVKRRVEFHDGAEAPFRGENYGGGGPTDPHAAVDGSTSRGDDSIGVSSDERQRVCEDLLGLPGELVLAASLDLETLQALPNGAVPPWLPRNTLLLELDDGWRVFPPVGESLLEGTQAPAAPTPSWADVAGEGRGSQAPTSRGPGRAPRETPPRETPPRETLARELSSAESLVQRVGLFGGLLGRSNAHLVAQTPERRAAADRSGRATPTEGPAPPVDPNDLAERLTAAWAGPGPPTGPPPEAPAEAPGRVQAGLAELLTAERALRTARTRRDQAAAKLDGLLETRRRAREQQAGLETLARSAAELGLRERRSLQGASRARKAAGVSFRVVLLQTQALADALKVLRGACMRLQEAVGELEMEGRGERLRTAHRRLVGRRCHLASGLALVYEIGPRTITEPEAPPGGFPWEKLDHMWTGVAPEREDEGTGARNLDMARTDLFSNYAPSEAAGSEADSSAASSAEWSSCLSRVREVAVLCVGGLELEPMLGRRGLDGVLGWDGDVGEARRAGAALGYVAHCVGALATYLDVPLRYPIRTANSRSTLLDHPPPAGTFGLAAPAPRQGDSGFLHLLQRRAGDVNPGGDWVPVEFPLFFDGGEATRFAYAIFLLNKDVEQLLDAHGLLASGPGQLLQNLYKLLAAAESGVPRPPPRR